MKKRILSFVLCVMMLLTSGALPVSATEVVEETVDSVAEDIKNDSDTNTGIGTAETIEETVEEEVVTGEEPAGLDADTFPMTSLVVANTSPVPTDNADITVTVKGYSGGKDYIAGRITYRDAFGRTENAESVVAVPSGDLTPDIAISFNLKNLAANTTCDYDIYLAENTENAVPSAGFLKVGSQSIKTGSSDVASDKMAIVFTEDYSYSSGKLALTDTGTTAVGKKYNYGYRERKTDGSTDEWVVETPTAVPTPAAGASVKVEHDITGLLRNTTYDVRFVVDGIVLDGMFKTSNDTRMLTDLEVLPGYTTARVDYKLTGNAGDKGYVYAFYRANGTSGDPIYAGYKECVIPDKATYVDGPAIDISGLTHNQKYDIWLQLRKEAPAESTPTVTPGYADSHILSISGDFTTLKNDYAVAIPEAASVDGRTASINVKLTRTSALDSKYRATVILAKDGGTSADDKVSVPVELEKSTSEGSFASKEAIEVPYLLPAATYNIKVKVETQPEGWGEWIAVGDPIAPSDSDSNKSVTVGSVPAEATPTGISLSDITVNKDRDPVSLDLVVVGGTADKVKQCIKWEVKTSTPDGVITIDDTGKVTPKKAGTATVKATSLANTGITDTCTVTVVDYELRTVDGTDSTKTSAIGNAISPGLSRKLGVWDKTAGALLSRVTWTISGEGIKSTIDENTGVITANAEDVRKTVKVTASIADDVILTHDFVVTDEVKGLSIVEPKAVNDKYKAIAISGTEYQIAYGESYDFRCVAAPAYISSDGSPIYLTPGSDFEWAITEGYESCLSGSTLTVPASKDTKDKIVLTARVKSGTLTKEYSMTLGLLKKPPFTTIPDTYLWIDASNKLSSAGLPDKWQWVDPDTRIYMAERKDFSAKYVNNGYYPYETKVGVITYNNPKSEWKIDGTQTGKPYTWDDEKETFFVKRGETMPIKWQVKTNCSTLTYDEVTAIKAYVKVKKRTPVKNDDKDKEEKDDDEEEEKKIEYTETESWEETKDLVVTSSGAGAYKVKATKDGVYKLEATVTLYKAGFKDGEDKYVLKRGDKLKNIKAYASVTVSSNLPIESMKISRDTYDLPAGFKWEQDENGNPTGIVYEITKDTPALSSKKELAVHLIVKDIVGNYPNSPKIKVSSSNTSICDVKQKDTKLTVTVPSKTEGTARITVVADDALGKVLTFTVSVRDYKPKIAKAYTPTLYLDYPAETYLADVLIPYMYVDGKKINDKKQLNFTLVERSGETTPVKGLKIETRSPGNTNIASYHVTVKIDSANKPSTGTFTYYLAVETLKHELTYLPVKMKITTKTPGIKISQKGNANLFYKDTSGWDYTVNKKILPTLTVTSSDKSLKVAKVEWEGGTGGFAINPGPDGIYYITQKNIALSGKKAPDSVRKGKVKVTLEYIGGNSNPGDEPVTVEKAFTIKSTYKKPTISFATSSFAVCPGIAQKDVKTAVRSNVYGTKTILVGQSGAADPAAKASEDKRKALVINSDITSSNSQVGVTFDNGIITVTNDAATTQTTVLSISSPYWNEPITKKISVKVKKVTPKLSRSTVTLNTLYPADLFASTAFVTIDNSGTKLPIKFDSLEVIGANEKSKKIYGDGLVDVKAVGMEDAGAVSRVRTNICHAGTITAGTYKYKLTPSVNGTKLKAVTLNVKIVNKKPSVKHKVTGSIDLVKTKSRTSSANNPDTYIKAKPTFSNIDGSMVIDKNSIKLGGSYADLFEAEWNADGTVHITQNRDPYPPGDFSAFKPRLVAGKSYKLTLTYTLKSSDGSTGKEVVVESASFTVKPKQSKPKVKASATAITFYPKNGESETGIILTPPETNYIEGALGRLDVNGDGKYDIIIASGDIEQVDTNFDKKTGRQLKAMTHPEGWNGTIPLTVRLADAASVKAGEVYTIPVTVFFYGHDGVAARTIQNIKITIAK